MPTPPPPAPRPPPQVVIIPRQGMGCFAKGCLTVLIVGFLFFAALLGGAWYFYNSTVANLTSSAPLDVRIEQPSEAQFQAAESTRARLNDAIARNAETTVEFSSADLNALLARDEDFREFRGRARVDIADSMMTIALSVPLDSIPLRKLRKRWFNGTARFGFAYSSGEFEIDLQSLEAGQHRLPRQFLSSYFMDAFNDGLNEAFDDDLRKGNRETEFWSHVKTMSLQGDKLVVTTKAD
ncbi:MAG TPA: hypothetical protein VGW39_06425 [Chthoniobacterales bacterium]|nr:hypothetical protein [Chthoniobacterales bacterium]